MITTNEAIEIIHDKKKYLSNLVIQDAKYISELGITSVDLKSDIKKLLEALKAV